MTRPSRYRVEHLAGRGLDRLPERFERESLLEVSDAGWRLYFRDSRRGLTCGLSACAMDVEELSRHRCRLTISDPEVGRFDLELVLRASANRVRRDLGRRQADVARAGRVVEAVASGDWWLDAQVFEPLDWAGVRSIAGVRYRHGWWGTGRMEPSMSAKVLDFGPSGIRLRGWRTRFLIPWDAVGAVGVVDGDAWMPDPSTGGTSLRSGATIVVTSGSGQDAVFFTPLLQAAAVRDALEPLTRNLRGSSPALADATPG